MSETPVGSGGDTLVEKEFWEEEYYWANVQPPCLPDLDMPFDQSMAHALERLAPAQQGERVIEIGCAPAKWLAYYGQRFGVIADGVEYSEKGANLSQANLDALGLEGKIHHADFFTTDAERYDVVLSFGFIEHFDDLEGVFARHLDFVKPGGRLVIGVPNFRGLNKTLQRWSDPAYLALHNLRAMDPALYRRLGAEHGLERLHQEYIGGPDPIIIKLGKPWITPLVLAEARFRRLGFTERLNSGFASPYLLTVFRTPAA
jgi:SAM-dependent methyltransferase